MGLELVLASELGVMVFLQGAVAEFVAFSLAGSGQQDQRGGVGRLGRERKIEQDERVGIPLKAEGGRVRGDPEHDHNGLADDEPWGAEKTREAFSGDPEAVVAERSVVHEAMGGVWRHGASFQAHLRQVRTRNWRGPRAWSPCRIKARERRLAVWVVAGGRRRRPWRGR